MHELQVEMKGGLLSHSLHTHQVRRVHLAEPKAGGTFTPFLLSFFLFRQRHNRFSEWIISSSTQYSDCV